MNEQASVFLLVEDNEDDAYFMQRAFQDAGLNNRLCIVTNGDQAIDYIDGTGQFADRKQHPLPDLIFLDLKMPGRDGFDVLEWIRQEKGLKTPVAVLTSSPEEMDRKRARELGADCYLLKPPSTSMILGCCRQFQLNCH